MHSVENLVDSRLGLEHLLLFIFGGVSNETSPRGSSYP